MTKAVHPTVVRHTAGMHVFLWTAFPLAGAVAGFVLAHVPEWIAALPWFPNQTKIAELAGVIGPKVTAALVVVGVLAGVVVALMARADLLTVRIADDSITVRRNNDEAAFGRDAVSGAFVDAKELVLLGPSGEEQAREKTDLKPPKLRAGFEAHWYVWHEHDPYAAQFTRWIDGSTGLSQDANAILRARQAAIENDDADDRRELRQELARHGVFVRDEGKRQYWRAV
ncbi:YqeB family protein [Pseudonocardia sp. TRM90224]|uniref:YqeB family protein n=1 Tax=Pseudonocardia sp. TRM90224 TaxID=2812678 RepID=UPI001E50DF43|nr:hypothetical protein [Pseudonocardia sp. TRM90224]